jgi:quinol-cytochrome oxidoreductase complex cytochrome b subunit
MMDQLLLALQSLRHSRVWLSIFRREQLPQTEADWLAMNRRNFFVHVLPAKIHRGSARLSYNWLWMGVVSTWLFAILTVTGIFLMFYFVPSVERAYDSVKEIMNSVTLGRFMRNMHRWAANVMVFAVALHMLRVFWTASYQKPREFNWVIGVLLFVVTIMFAFSGYIVPWDQLGYYAAKIAANIADGVPYIGPQVKQILLGGTDLNQPSLLRWYVIHVFVLPLVIVLLIGVHFWRIRKDDYSKPIDAERGRKR